MKGRPPPVDKLLLPAIGIAIALLAYHFIKGLGADVSECALMHFIYVFAYFCFWL